MVPPSSLAGERRESVISRWTQPADSLAPIEALSPYKRRVDRAVYETGSTGYGLVRNPVAVLLDHRSPQGKIHVDLPEHQDPTAAVLRNSAPRQSCPRPISGKIVRSARSTEHEAVRPVARQFASLEFEALHAMDRNTPAFVPTYLASPQRHFAVECIRRGIQGERTVPW